MTAWVVRQEPLVTTIARVAPRRLWIPPGAGGGAARDGAAGGPDAARWAAWSTRGSATVGR